MDLRFLSPDELLRELGARLRERRIHRNLEQTELAERAGISVRALRNLELGSGSTMETFIRVLKALDSLQGLDALVPVPMISPMALLGRQRPRLRVRKPKEAKP